VVLPGDGPELDEVGDCPNGNIVRRGNVEEIFLCDAHPQNFALEQV